MYPGHPGRRIPSRMHPAVRPVVKAKGRPFNSVACLEWNSGEVVLLVSYRSANWYGTQQLKPVLQKRIRKWHGTAEENS
ncbi:hypothetical protein CHL76_04080 [Marinococcus halophilus]|nr:hypothetical protein CHL76_04080 [Marinococcus halophilus]